MTSKGLGTGLGALFGDAALEPEGAEYVLLPISKVEPGSQQPRKYFDELALTELAESIEKHGIIQPLTVRKQDSGRYQIIAGERRWRAARQAGLSDVPCLIIEADDATATELALIENLQREDLNPIEEAEGFRALIEDYNLTQEETAERLSKSRPAIANALRLLSLPPEVKDFLEQGIISSGHGRATLQVPRSCQLDFARKIISDGLSVRQAEALAKRLSMEGKQPKKKKPEGAVNYIGEVETKLTKCLGRKVKIVGGEKKGKFEIEYYDSEDLEQVINALESLTLSRGK